MTEIAPGIDLQRDVLTQMNFTPLMPTPLRLMAARLFADGPMGLRERLLAIPLDHRLACDADSHALFINFERLQVRTPRDVAAVQPHIHESSDEALKHLAPAKDADKADQTPGG